MKHISRFVKFLLIFLLALPVLKASAALDSGEKAELRGVWVATVLNIDYPSKPVIDSEVLKNEALKILEDAENTGFNAVFLQVRPASDAIYNSRIFPWSRYLTGKQGLIPAKDFDPLEFWVSEAHKRGIELHAWINPYRITKKTAKDPKYDLSSLDAMNPAIKNPGWVVKYSDGNLYYDPGIPQVRGLVLDGILEILRNYDVDGIHFDDYFYPGKDFNDKTTYKKYGTGFGSIEEWRRGNVNTLIRDLSKAIKETRPDVRFGISPFGIWANKGSNALGSDTKGMQSYYDQYADTRKWVKEGYIDYIAPQLYWNIGFEVADYAKLLDWWADTVSGTNVDLYIGQAAYRCGNSESSSPWYGVSEIEKQLLLNSQKIEIKGSIFFSCKSLRDNPELTAAIKTAYQEKDSLSREIPVSISRPSENISTKFESYYLCGSSDPRKPLLLNGKPLENRSPDGYFGILVPLEAGTNTYVFSQDSSSETRVIQRDIPSEAPIKMAKADITPSSVFPQTQEYRTPGEKVTLSCKAPVGSTVTVKINGKSYTMVLTSKDPKASGLYEGTFAYSYTIPSFTGTPRIVDLGAPVYAMNYKGTIRSVKAPGKIGAIMKGSPFFAKIEKETAYIYNTPSSSNGAAFELAGGMTDRITGMTGNYARLSLGQWINKNDVEIYTSKNQPYPIIKGVEYKTGEWWDSLRLAISSSAAATAAFDGTFLTFSITADAEAALPALPEGSLFSSVKVAKDGITRYVLEISSSRHIEGYYVEKTSEGLALNIKKPVRANSGELPLGGITIMLDPGHGGSDHGAIGPLGKNYSEKTINMNIALKLKSELESLGAKIALTRTENNDVSLEERLSASRSRKPDMFISLHANSMEDNVDISKVDGLSVFYREELSSPLAKVVFDSVLADLGRNNKGMHKKNFYVIRGSWTPSILVESGFVPNPNEFEWLIDENEQIRLAKSISEAVLKYFRQGN